MLVLTNQVNLISGGRIIDSADVSNTFQSSSQQSQLPIPLPPNFNGDFEGIVKLSLALLVYGGSLNLIQEIYNY
jgi:hypothetical protein